MAHSSAIPQLRRHKPSKQGVVRLNGKDHYLGVWPADETKPPQAVLRRYNALIAEWLANGRRPLGQDGISVAEVLVGFLEHAKVHYPSRPDRRNNEYRNFVDAFKHLERLYADLPAAEFSPNKLKSIRELMIDDGLARTTINTRIGRIIHVFKWAVGEELVPVEVWQALTAVGGLKAGRTRAKEPERVQPVDDEIVAATIPHLLHVPAAMIQLLRATGMRVGECCDMRPCEIDRTGDVWIYQPESHKNLWRGKCRYVVLGPKAQAILTPFLDRDPESYCFSPAEAIAKWQADKREASNESAAVARGSQEAQTETPTIGKVQATSVAFGRPASSGQSRRLSMESGAPPA